MKSLWKDERGLTGAYIRVVVSVIMVAFTWIILNEFVLRVGSAASSISTNPDFPGTSSLLLYLWRFAPVVLLISTIIWAILASIKERPDYGGM